MNKLVVIGYIGLKTCYLNVSREEAQRRYVAKEGEDLSQEELDRITFEYEFEDEFGAYDAWAETT